MLALQIISTVVATLSSAPTTITTRCAVILLYSFVLSSTDKTTVAYPCSLSCLSLSLSRCIAGLYQHSLHYLSRPLRVRCYRIFLAYQLLSLSARAYIYSSTSACSVSCFIRFSSSQPFSNKHISHWALQQ